MEKKLPVSSKLPFDIRAEVLARQIAEGFDMNTEQILIRPVYFHQRPGRRDVTEVSEDYSERLEKPLIALEVSREGLFDTLPEHLFLHPEDNYPDDTYKVKALTVQEDEARTFLAPFEQLFFWLQIENEQREYATEQTLEEWWSQLLIDTSAQGLSDRQRKIMVQLLPFLPEIIGNWTLTAQWLSLIMEQEIAIMEVPPPVYQLPGELTLRLGEGFLGQNFVIGETFSDGIPSIEIFFGEMDATALVEMLPEGGKRKSFETEILDFLLPADTPYSIKFKTTDYTEKMSIEVGSVTNVLGYSTVI